MSHVRLSAHARFHLSLAATCVSSALALATGHASAQCTTQFQTSMLGTYDRIGPPLSGARQRPTDAWRFYRSDGGGFDGGALTGVLIGGYTVGSWGSPDQSFSVPLVGARFSPAAARNEVPFYSHTPTIEGLMFHPGSGSVDTIARTSGLEGKSLDGLVLAAEDLGSGLSPNVLIRAELHRAGNVVLPLVASTSVDVFNPASFISPASGVLPILGQPGDEVWVIVNNGGLPSADWLNLDIRLTLSGPPLILRQPVRSFHCPSGSTSFSVLAEGAATTGLAYFWQIETAPGDWHTLGNDPGPLACSGGSPGSFAFASPLNSPTVTIAARGCPGPFRVRALVSNACGTTTSDPVALVICPADFNCSNTLNVQDIFDFLNAWFALDPHADFNTSGAISVQDIFDFLAAWFHGC